MKTLALRMKTHVVNVDAGKWLMLQDSVVAGLEQSGILIVHCQENNLKIWVPFHG